MSAANTYADQGQFQRAIKEYDKVLRLRPKYLDGYLNRGYAYFNLGDARRAVRDFDETIRLAPTLGGAYARRALAHALLGNDKEAEADVKRATELGFDVSSLNEAVEELKEKR